MPPMVRASTGRRRPRDGIHPWLVPAKPFGQIRTGRESSSLSSIMQKSRCSSGDIICHHAAQPPGRAKKMFDPKEILGPDYITAAKRAEFIVKEQLSLAMEAWMDEEFGKTGQAERERTNTDGSQFVSDRICHGLEQRRFPKGRCLKKASGLQPNSH